MTRMTRDGIAQYVSRDLILRRERGQLFLPPGTANHKQDWESYLLHAQTAERQEAKFNRWLTTWNSADLASQKKV